MKVSLSFSFLETVFSTYEASRSVHLPSGFSIMSSVIAIIVYEFLNYQLMISFNL